MIGGPQPPRSCLGRSQEYTIDAEATKVHGWANLGILVVAEDDSRLSWIERETVRQLGKKLYGHCHRERYHGHKR